jgi:hypothetical protein
MQTSTSNPSPPTNEFSKTSEEKNEISHPLDIDSDFETDHDVNEFEKRYHQIEQKDI